MTHHIPRIYDGFLKQDSFVQKHQKDARAQTVSSPLLDSKLSIPPTPLTLVARPHLIQWLDEATQRPLTLLSASAGCGKTTLLSEWVQHTGYPTAWVSLDEHDNTPLYFWRYVLTALQTLYEDVGVVLTQLHSSQTQSSIETILPTLINILSFITHDFALVLDDYHVIETQSIHDAMNFLLDYLPSQMHLIIASRSNPSFPLARLRAYGKLSELHSTSLYFTSQETKTWLTHKMHMDLPEELLSALERRTEGWIAGLQLAVAALQLQEDHKHFLAVFTGSHRYILDYFVEQVFYQQADILRSFLLHTSLLERLSAPLCEAVTGNTMSRTILEQLEHANVFLFPLDHQRCWYRYHPLFREALYTRLQQSQPDLAPELHQRAFRWYEHSGLITEAIPHALAAHAFEQAAHLITHVGETMIRSGEATTLLVWLDRLPDEVKHSCLQICRLQAQTSMAIGQSNAAGRELQEAERAEKEYGSGKEIDKVRDAVKCDTLTTGTSAEPLSERELEIVQGIVAGMSNREIAQWLIVAETTVKWHVRNIFSKLRVQRRSQIIALMGAQQASLRKVEE